MTYRFQSKVAADILMLSLAGDSVLRGMGLMPSAKGIIEPDQLLAAITAIEAAIAQEESNRPANHGATKTEPTSPDQCDTVSLRQRAWPLVDMMRQALAAGEYVVWGV